MSLRDSALVAQVIDWHEAGLNFADAMHLATSGNAAFRTFDGDFIKRAGKVTGRQVSKA